jgi:hypothetical protein
MAYISFPALEESDEAETDIEPLSVTLAKEANVCRISKLAAELKLNRKNNDDLPSESIEMQPVFTKSIDAVDTHSVDVTHPSVVTRKLVFYPPPASSPKSPAILAPSPLKPASFGTFKVPTPFTDTSTPPLFDDPTSPQTSLESPLGSSSRKRSTRPSDESANASDSRSIKTRRLRKS